MIKPAPRVRRETTEQFRGGQNDEIRRWKTKSAGERAENKIDILQRVRGDQLAEAFDLALGLKINDDPRFVPLPFRQSLDELIAFGFGEEKIADREFTDAAILKCAAEILRTFFNPAFANPDLRVR